MPRYILFLILSVFSLAMNAAVYKCVVNGETVYSDRPCADESIKMKLAPGAAAPAEQSRVPITPSTGRPDDYYSVENQLKRIEAEKERQRQERREEISKDAQLKAQEQAGQGKPQVDKARCEYYKSRVKEQEYRLHQGYKSQQEKLSDESYLNLLRLNASRYCE